jgi:hypothetical protein
VNAVKQREDAVFYTAVSLGDSQLRRQFIAQAGANNPGLRTAVEEMLAAEARGGPFFAKSRSALEVPVKGGGGSASRGRLRQEFSRGGIRFLDWPLQAFATDRRRGVRSGLHG